MYPYTVKIIQSATQYLTWNESSGLASRIITKEMTHNLNHPRTFSMRLSNLDAGVLNYLSSSFAGWTGGYTGPIAVGQEIQYDTIEMDFATGSYSTASLTFYGIITEISQDDAGSLIITAKDITERLEHIYASKTVFDHYRDQVACEWEMRDSTETPGSKIGIRLLDAGTAYPAVQVRFATDDQNWQIAVDDAVDTAWYQLMEGDYACQEFIATSNGVYAFGFWYSTWDGWTTGNGHVVFKILRDNGSDIPDFAREIVSRDDLYLTAHGLSDHEWYENYWKADKSVVLLEEGQKYWFCVLNHNSGDDPDTSKLMVFRDVDSTYKADHTASHTRMFDEGPDTWSSEAGNLQCHLWMVSVTEVSPDDYHFEYIAPHDWIIFDKSPGQWNADQYPASLDPTQLLRGIASYYYGTRTTQDILDAIIPLDYTYFKAAGNRVISSLLSVTRHLFRTKGKSLGASMRELCDSMAVYTGGNYFQSAYTVYDHPGETYEHIIRCGRKMTTWYDSASYAIAYGTWIVSVDAKVTTNNRPCRVVVIGKTTAAGTITATVEDDDWLAQCKIPMTETIQDDTIQTVDDAYAQANARIQSYQRGVWEGSMRLAGIFPQLMQEHSPTAGVGDGVIIEVTWPPLAWSSLKLKVVGITIGENCTDVSFNNADLLLSNKFIQNFRRQQLSESFVSPTNAETVLYFPIYSSKTTSTTPLYAQLCTASATPISGGHKRVKGSSHDSTNPVRRVWHFEFDARNGATADGTPIDRIEIYTAATGGSALTDIVFATDLSSAYAFYKWKTTKLIVDLVINPS